MPLGAKIVVIDESLVLKCIQQSQIDVTGATQNSDDVEFNELKTLRLSFECACAPRGGNATRQVSAFLYSARPGAL